MVIDGAFLVKAYNHLGKDVTHFVPWLDRFCDEITPKHHWRFRTYYIDALPYKRYNNPSSKEKRNYAEKENFFRKINRLERYSVREGYCKLETHTDIEDGVRRRKITQKMVDVLFSTEVTRIAWSGEAKHITIIAGDGDYVPAVIAAQNAGVIMRLYYGNRGSTKTAQKLMDIVDERFDLFEALERDSD